MPRYVAFLGGINVGGHRVAMDELCAHCSALGLDDVWSFIASGNVVFSSRRKAPGLEQLVAEGLEAALGYGVPTFVRTEAQVIACSALKPFGEIAEGHTHMVGFLGAAPTAACKKATETLSNDFEELEVHGTELHWLMRGKSLDSRIKPRELTKALGTPLTTRNTKSLAKLAQKLEG